MSDPIVEMLRYGTGQEAADGAIKSAVSMYHDAKDAGNSGVEFGTAILQCSDQDGNVFFQHAPPNAGPKAGQWETRLKLPPGCKVDRIVHTHRPEDSHAGGGGLSPHDKDVVNALRVPSYVATPGPRREDPVNVHMMDPDGKMFLNGKRQSSGRRR